MLRRLVLLLVILLIGAVPVHAENAAVTIGVGDTVLVVTGRTSPNAFVTITNTGTLIGTTTADANGDFTKTFPGFSPGIHQIGFYAKDTADRLTDFVSTQVNVVEHFQTTVNAFLPTTLSIEPPSAQVGEQIRLFGSTYPGSTVTITLGGTTLQTTADASGNWEYNVTTATLTVGQHSFYVVATESGGDQSYPTATHSFLLTALPTSPPGQQGSIPTIQQPAPPVITSPQNGTVVSTKDITVQGTAQPGTRIELYDGSRLIGATFTDANGNWSLVLSLSEAAYELRARACNGIICSDFSNPINLYYQPGKIIGLFKAYLDMYSYNAMLGDQTRLGLHIRGGTTPYTVTVQWGDKQIDRFETSQMDLDLTHIYQYPDKFNGTVEVRDKNGLSHQLSFAVEVRAKEQLTYWWFWGLLLAVLLLCALWRYYRHRQKHKEQQNNAHPVKNNN